VESAFEKCINQKRDPIMKASWLLLGFTFLWNTSSFAEPLFKSHRFDDDVPRIVEAAPWLSGIKNIQLGSLLLDVGGEARISREWFRYPDFGTATNQSQGYWAARYAGHFNLRGPEDFRLFAQLKYSNVEGKEGNPGRLDNDFGDLQQLFIDKVWHKDGNPLLVRLGRQEAVIGSGRWVSVREGPNSRLTFDAARLQYNLEGHRLEIFAGRPTLIERGSFDNKPDVDNAFVSFEGSRLWTLDNTGIDAYLMYFQQKDAEYGSLTGTEDRYALGTRWLTQTEKFQSNTDVVLQWGRLGEKDILAYGATSEMSWKTAWPSMQALLKLSYFTGDGATGEGSLGTFNPFYPRGTYYGWSAQIGHPNLIAIQPGISYQLAADLKMLTDLGFYWRQSKSDLIYRGNGTPMGIPVTDQDKTFTGSQFNLQAEWQTTALVVTSFEYSHFFENIDISELKDSEFIAARVYFKF
jgi:hypothetical protein